MEVKLSDSRRLYNFPFVAGGTNLSVLGIDMAFEDVGWDGII